MSDAGDFDADGRDDDVIIGAPFADNNGRGDFTPPAAPVLTDSDPDSPANDNSPESKGSAEAGSTVQLFTNASCTGPSVASGSAAAFASPGLTVSVADNSSTTFYATATDAADRVSPCSSGLTYVEDSTPPAAPVLTDTDPDSPANDNLPEVKGTAEALSTVRLYTDAACMDPSVASGSAATFASAGLTVTVASDSSTTFYATATDAAGNASACSRGLTHVEDSTPPDTIIDSGPAEGSTTTATTATFTFHATETGSTFGCELDTGPVEACDLGTKTYTGRVLGNDSDADNDALTAQLGTTTTKGALTLNVNGSFTYTPGEDATGTDTFTYRAVDGLATSNLATVTITITAGCDGVRATRVGTPGNDTLTGTGGSDRHQLFGDGGADRLFGGGDPDALDGGDGTPDLCDGEGGSDTATAACENTTSVP